MLEDGSIYPRHILGSGNEFQVCLLESPMVAELAHKDSQTIWAQNNVTLVNARLIEAAPELLEEMVILRDWTRQVAARGDVPQGIRDAAARLHDDTKRLCAKATASTTDAGVVG